MPWESCALWKLHDIYLICQIRTRNRIIEIDQRTTTVYFGAAEKSNHQEDCFCTRLFFIFIYSAKFFKRYLWSAKEVVKVCVAPSIHFFSSPSDSTFVHLRVYYIKIYTYIYIWWTELHFFEHTWPISLVPVVVELSLLASNDSVLTFILLITFTLISLKFKFCHFRLYTKFTYIIVDHRLWSHISQKIRDFFGEKN